METGLQPRDTVDLADLISAAAASATPLVLTGGRSHDAVGRPDRAAIRVDMRAFNGIIDHDPEELVLTVGAATPLAHVRSVLAECNQMLAFEPLWPGASRMTIGGVVATNLSGPRRVTAGCARDHVLGCEGVTGRGEAIRAGGRVVKNVTGFDLPRLVTGSWGQLIALTSITLKIVPRPRHEATLLFRQIPADQAVRMMTEVLGLPLSLSGAGRTPDGTVAMRLGGTAASVSACGERLERLFAAQGEPEWIGVEETGATWQQIGQAGMLRADGNLWRLSQPAERAPALVQALEEADAQTLLDWAGGLAWVAADASLDVRSIAARHGASAMLVRADEGCRRTIMAMPPEASGVAALRRRLKHGFDPAAILDPLRFGDPCC